MNGRKSIATGAAALAVAIGAGAALAQGAGVQPGRWEIAITINSVEMKGVPPGIAKMMIGKTTRVRHCITPEAAARGPQDLLKSDKSCVFTRYSMVGGRLDSAMSCRQGGGTMTAVSTGTFTPTGFTATGRSVSSGEMATTMTSTSVGRRIGDCR